MGAVHEYRFIDRFQYHTKGLLHQLIRESGNPQRTHFAVRLLNISTAGRVRGVGFISKHFDDLFYLCLAETIRCVRIYPLG